ncbi:MAG: hypothetical protein QNK16_13540 [Woeseiaceae bacterium]|nr:hypothetical protein [Woeseiaceae bacterium]MDX2609402.1 hypothetical protein [Woeseiaceae bacterium]
MAKKKNQPVEVRIEIDGLKATAVPNEHSAEFDRLLEQQGADSFVFIPLARLGKKGQRLSGNPSAIARKKAKLPAVDWYDGELRSVDDDNAVPGVLAFDIRRRTAREIAEAVGVNQFMWGTSGAPVEPHDVKIFKDDAGHSWKSSRARAFVGLSDMAISARHIAALPTAVEESQTTMEKFWQLVAVVLGAAIAAGAAKAVLSALLNSDESTSWLASIINVLFYPFVIPAVLVGIYLRVLMQRSEEHARDFTAAEAEQNWIKVAPHLLALWALCWMAIVLLTWLQSVPSADLGLFGRTDGVTTSFIICVWMLLPIAHSHDVETLFKSAFESGITAAVSIFTIKLSLYLTNLVTDAVFGVLTNLLPFEIPERLQQLISSVINFGAEVFFMAVLLGYAWSRTRQQFMRL